jgi:phenylacetate-CoA ligase
MSPLWLMTLITLAKKLGIDPKKEWNLRIGILGGQSVSTTFREEMESMMPDGFKAHNVYGTTEAGGPVLGISCPHSHAADEMHLINEDSVLVEVLDPKTLQPVAPGEVGEIVLTTLDKEASPAVRWRTRDLTRLSKNPYGCACGRSGYPLISRIIGRSDDMIKVRGVMVFPSQIEDVITGIEGTVKEAWQVYVDKKNEDSSLNDIEVAFERQSESCASDEELLVELKSRLKSRLGVSCKVVCQAEGTLPRYEAKAVRLIYR